MNGILIYLYMFLIILTALLIFLLLNILPINLSIEDKVPLYCIISAGYGGLIYLFRSIYIHRCFQKDWDDDCKQWYYVRPINSLIIGGFAYIFLKAGLLVLETESINTPTYYAYYAISFIAGLNVSNFLKKIEDIAKTVFGIEKQK